MTNHLVHPLRLLCWTCLLTCYLLPTPVVADGPRDNVADKVRPVPPTGIDVPAADRAELEKGVAALGQQIDALRTNLKAKPALLGLLPDVEIFYSAVRYPLAYREFYNANEIAVAKTLLTQGHERALQLAAGQTPWTTARGLVVRGYRSRIDGSVQPYGLVVPENFEPGRGVKHRLDFWCHGRGETLTELAFLDQRQKSAGEFAPAGAFVVHLYGRYCNANKFAGEIDLLEVRDEVTRRYPIDEQREVIRGFSMGGAACWQFAVHYPSLWAAAAPGAGFSETPDFLRVFQNETISPTDYERKLLHMYDCTDYALNLFNCPTVAYSGEKDRQKQAADIMAKALAAEGMQLCHIIGPGTEHSYHPQAKEELNRRIDAIVAIGRPLAPRHVRFTTWTLRYPSCDWVTIAGLEQHWQRARIDALLAMGRHQGVTIATANISALTLNFPPGACPLDDTEMVQVDMDEQTLEAPAPLTDRSWTAHFRKEAGKWRVVESLASDGLSKVPGLQGPIDDAFMDSFLMVRPTGKAASVQVGAWVAAEQAHAIDHWRKQFRGEARVKDDTQVTDADIAEHNLVLWGDAHSNQILSRIADKLPLRWVGDKVQLGSQSFAALSHVPVLVYPNPLNPQKYVVLNSGFTFREYDYLNNARQVSKLPDYAVIDINSPVTSRAPGKIAAAGFFDERWQLPVK